MKLHPLVSVHFYRDKCLLTHCGTLDSILAPDWVGRDLQRLGVDGHTVDDSEIDGDFLDTLLDRGFTCPDELTQDDAMSSTFSGFFADLHEGQTKLKEAYAKRVQHWSSPRRTESSEALEICMFGGCTFEIASTSIEPVFAARGHRTRVHITMPQSGEYERMARRHPDAALWIIQPFVRFYLERIYKAALDPSASFSYAVDGLGEALRLQLTEAAQAARGRLCLVHNLSPPHLPIDGRLDRRWPAVFRELNTLIDRFAGEHANVLVVDEDRISSGIGREGLYDSTHRVFGHYAYSAGLLGGHQMPPWGDSARMQVFLDTLAEEYLVSYEAWTRRPRLKVVIVDLDGTIWPGNIGDEGFELDHQKYQVEGPYQGLQEALALLRRRGVLLAVVSKNSEEIVVPRWNAMQHLYVRYDDFVLCRINWRRKSQNIREILERLQCSPAQALFIDDNPVERAEVAGEIPALEVFGGEIEDARRFLLEHPKLEFLAVSEDAERRSSMMEGQLRRDDERARFASHEAFLSSLEIRMTIRRSETADLLRVGELIERTNQFNSTAERISREDTLRLSRDDRIWIMSARDRFVDYGIVGVLVLEDVHIRLFAMSCRVLPLGAAVPFASEVLRVTDNARRRVTGTLIRNTRNEPCHSFFSELGFQPVSDELWALDDPSALPDVDPDVYRIQVQLEA